MESGDHLPVDMDSPIPEFGIGPPIPIFRMRPGDRQQGFPQPLIFLFITSLAMGIRPSTIGKPQGRQDLVQPIFILERPLQLNFFPRAELPAKIFFKSAISTSLCPISRSSSSIHFSYSSIVVSWAKISGPFAMNSFFQCLIVIGRTP